MLNQPLDQFSTLSPRSIECCLHAGINTLGDLFDVVRASGLSSIEASGPLVVKELSELMSRYEKRLSGYQYDLFSIPDSNSDDDLPVTDRFVSRIASPKALEKVSAVYAQALESIPSGRAKTFKEAFPDAATLLFTISREHKVITMVDRDWSVADNVHFWDFCSLVLSAMLEVVTEDADMSLASLIKKSLETLNANMRYRKFALVMPSLSQMQLTVLADEYQSVFNGLSTRAKGVLSNSGLEMREVLEMTFSTDPASFRYKNAGVGTFNEIKQRFSPLVDRAIALIDCDEAQLAASHLMHRLPSLPEPVIMRLAELQQQLGHLPLFYLTYWMLKTSNDRADQVFASINGIGCSKMSRSEVAKSLKISLERVRQIINVYKPSDLLSEIINENIGAYTYLQEEFLDPAVSCSKVVEMESGEGTEYSMDCLSGILRLLFAAHTVSYDDHSYVVSDKLASCFDFKSALRALSEISQTRRTSSQLLPLRNVIDPYLKTSDQQILEKITEMMLRIIADTRKWLIHDAPCAVLPQNTVIVEDEVYKVLYDHGSPMHINDIQAELSRRFPFRDFSKKESLRSYLIKSDRISAVGKTSTYTLNEWAGSTLTVRDHIYEILRKSTSPLTISEIKDALAQKGIDRSWTNIYSTIFTDTRRNYARYNKSYFGIASASYDPSYVQEPMKK